MKGNVREKKSIARLVLEDGSIYEGFSFGASTPIAGEVVFNTGMVGYPETLTDPSYFGQILVSTYPLVGNYGVPEFGEQNGLSDQYESDRMHISGLIVANYSTEHSHWSAAASLAKWLQDSNVPAITGIDTRALTKKLREEGTMLGKIEFGKKSIPFYDPNEDNLVARVSIGDAVTYGDKGPLVILIDCGAKHNIVRSLVRRHVNGDLRKLHRFRSRLPVQPEGVRGTRRGLPGDGGPAGKPSGRGADFPGRGALGGGRGPRPGHGGGGPRHSFPKGRQGHLDPALSATARIHDPLRQLRRGTAD